MIPALSVRPIHTEVDKEIVSKRKPNGKIYDLGGRQFELVSVPGIIHYKENPDDDSEQYKEIDLTIDVNGNVTRSLYNINIFTDKIGYTYTSRAGGKIDVELVEVDNQPVDSFTVRRENNQIFWDSVDTDLDLKIILKPTSAEIFKKLDSANSPRTFRWQVSEDIDAKCLFNRQTFGTDRQNQFAEITATITDEQISSGRKHFLYTEEWTGRVSRIVKKRSRQKDWSGIPAYPVLIDASTTELITATVDDGYQQGTVAVWYSQPPTAYGTAWPVGYSTGGPYTFNGGTRYRTLGVPQGATINSATLTGTVTTLNNTPSCTIFGDDVDSAALWSNGNLPTGITNTTASTNFSPTATGAFSVGITGVVQEIISRTGWASNNNIRFAWIEQVGTGANSYFQVLDYDNAQANAVQLNVVFTSRIPRYGFTNFQIPGIV